MFLATIVDTDAALGEDVALTDLAAEDAAAPAPLYAVRLLRASASEVEHADFLAETEMLLALDHPNVVPDRV